MAAIERNVVTRLGQALVAIVLVLGLAIPGVVPGSVAAQEIAAPTPPADGERALVVHVTDGDTVRIERADGSVERLRYIGIDTPETVAPGQPVEAWGPQATAANEALVADRIVLLERDTSERDRYDRLLRYVWVETTRGWIMVNAELVALGLAEVRAYEPDTRHDAWLRQVEDEARAAGLGIHGPPGPPDSPDPSGPDQGRDEDQGQDEDQDERSFLDELLDAIFGMEAADDR